MTQMEFAAILNREPFRPLVLRLKDGTTHLITDPDTVWVAPTYAFLAYPKFKGSIELEKHVIVSLVHIATFEPVPSTPAAS